MGKILVSKFNAFVDDFKTKHAKKLFTCFIATTICCLVAYAYAYFNCNLTHDCLNEFVASSLHKIRLGRFFIIPWLFIRGELALPWLIGIFTIIFLTCSVFLVSSIFNLESKVSIFLLSGFMSINIAVISTTGTYIHDLDIDMLALLFACIATYLWVRHDKIPYYIVSSIMVCFSLGLYQSYISVTITLIIFYSIISLLNKKSTKQVLIKGVWGLGILLVGCLLYYGLALGACAIGGTELESRVDVFAGGSSSIFKMLGNTYLNWGKFTFLHVPVWSRVVNIILISIAGLITIFTIVAVLLKKKYLSVGQKILIIILCILIPLGINTSYILSRGFSHDVMRYAFCLIYLLSMLCIKYQFEHKEIFNKVFSKACKGVGYTAISLVVIGNAITANTVTVKKDLDCQRTLSVMTEIVSGMNQTEGYVAGQTPVLFVGTLTSSTSNAFDSISSITGCWSDFSITYYQTIPKYFDIVLNVPLKILPEATKSKYVEEIKTLTSYPSKNCMEMFDGVLIVKLGGA